MKIAIHLVLIAAVTSAFSYPISPRPLRKLVSESEYIVIATVRNLRENTIHNGFSSGDIAELEVSEVLQGTVAKLAIEVSYNNNMICPAPPSFHKGTYVIAFLGKRGDAYIVPALSYGVKTLTLPEIEVYKARILEIQHILKLDNKDEQFLATVEWLVKCSENPFTRYEGTYELSRQSDFMSFYDKSESQPFNQILSNDQVVRLKNALLSTTEPSYSDLGLVDLIYAKYQEEVYAYLLKTLRDIKNEQVWVASAYMERIVLYKSSERLKSLIAKYDETLYGESMKKDQLITIIGNFLSEIDKL